MSDLSDLLGCFGYNGFGSGYSMTKFGPVDDTRELACGRCDVNHDCWERHKVRVRELLPMMTSLSDSIIASGLRGPAYIKEFIRQVGVKDPNKLVEPYLMIMMGNMEDGSNVAHHGKPVDRKNLTLSWPLIPL